MFSARAKSWAAALAAAALVLVLTACSRISGPAAQIFFPDQNQLFVVPITRFSPNPISPQFLLRQLVKGPVDREALAPVFPEGIVPSLHVSGGTIQLNLKMASPPPRWPLMLVPCVLATFKQLPGYNGVQFLVNGKADAVVGDLELGTESLRNFHLNDNLDLSNPLYRTGESRMITAYYRLKGTDYLVPVTLRIAPSGSIEEKAVEALEDNPRLPTELESPLQGGTQVVSLLKPADNIVDMTVKFFGSPVERKLADKALLLTMTDLPSIQYVRIRTGTGLFGWRPLQNRPIFVNMEREGNGG